MTTLRVEQPCTEGSAYWLSLYEYGGLYSSTGQVSYVQAHKQAAIWILIKNAERSYQIMHEADGFEITEEPHAITQECGRKGCHFRSRYSRYGVDRDFMHGERMSHLARHDRAGKRNFKIFCVSILIILIITVLGICGRAL